MKAIHCFQAVPSAFRRICGEDCKLNHHTRKGMSQSARGGGRGQRKGRNAPSRASPPIPPSTTDSPPPSSAPSAASGAHTPYNPVLARQQAQEKKYPLWKYVTRKDGPGAKLGGGGNVSWRCNFCNHEFKSTYFRVKGHLLALPSCGISSCKAVTANQRRDMEREDHVGLGKVAEASKKKEYDPLPFLRKSSSTKTPLPPSIHGRGDTYQTRKRQSTGGPMDRIFQQEAREEVDLTIAFFFYLNFISFNVARSPLYFEMVRTMLEKAPSGYVPPGSENLRTTLLVKAKKEVDKILEPIRTTWPSCVVSIVSDGWTDPTRHPLINFMVSSQNGPLFLKAVDALGEYKDAQFMSDLFIKTIEEVGVDSCVQIITDNAPVCKAAGMIVEAKYPQVCSFFHF